MTSIDRPARTAEFEALADHVMSWTRGERSIRLRFPPRSDIEADLRGLILREEECCAFLSFTLPELGNELCWDIESARRPDGTSTRRVLPLLSPGARIEAIVTEPRPTLASSRAPQRRCMGALVVAAACILAGTLPAGAGLASGAVFTLFDAPGWLVILAAGTIAGVVAGVRR